MKEITQFIILMAFMLSSATMLVNETFNIKLLAWLVNVIAFVIMFIIIDKEIKK